MAHQLSHARLYDMNASRSRAPGSLPRTPPDPPTHGVGAGKRRIHDYTRGCVFSTSLADEANLLHRKDRCNIVPVFHIRLNSSGEESRTGFST